MKQGKIYMKAWLDLHGRAKVLATDHWYLEFANLLLPVVSESYLYKSETQESQNQVTLMLTLYPVSYTHLSLRLPQVDAVVEVGTQLVFVFEYGSFPDGRYREFELHVLFVDAFREDQVALHLGAYHLSAFHICLLYTSL